MRTPTQAEIAAAGVESMERTVELLTQRVTVLTGEVSRIIAILEDAVKIGDRVSTNLTSHATHIKHLEAAVYAEGPPPDAVSEGAWGHE